MTGETAMHRLADGIAGDLDDGIVPVCAHDPRLWLAESPAERKDAASRCRVGPCHVFDLCAAAAGEVRATWGVWAGVDRGLRVPRAGQEPAA